MAFFLVRFASGESIIEEKNKEIEKAKIWKKSLMQGLFV